MPIGAVPGMSFDRVEREILERFNYNACVSRARGEKLRMLVVCSELVITIHRLFGITVD
jgi:hypothetical protein